MVDCPFYTTPYLGDRGCLPISLYFWVYEPQNRMRLGATSPARETKNDGGPHDINGESKHRKRFLDLVRDRSAELNAPAVLGTETSLQNFVLITLILVVLYDKIICFVNRSNLIPRRVCRC